MSDRLKTGRRLLEQGAAALRARSLGRSREAFGGALTVFGGPDIGLARAHALRGLGEVAAADQELDRAARLFDDAITEYRWTSRLLDHLALDPALVSQTRKDAVEGEALTHVMLANLALSRGDAKGAGQRINDAYPLFRQVEHPAAAANLWDTTARVAFWEGRTAAAIRAWERALALLTKDGDSRGRCLTSIRLADAYLATSRLADAERKLQDADELARDLDERPIAGRLYQAWGSWYARQEQFEAALDAYEDALTAFRDSNDSEMELHTLLRMARVASRSGRAEVVPKLRQAVAVLEAHAHATALGTVTTTIAEHALDLGKPEVALVAVASLRRFWGDRQPLNGWSPVLRLGLRALSALGSGRAAVTLAHHLVLVAGDEDTSAATLRGALRKRADADLLVQLDACSPEQLAARANSALDEVAGPWAARLSVPDEKLGTASAASILCDRLQVEGAAVIAVDRRGLTERRPVIVWETGDSERQEVALGEGITTVGRGADADVPAPWDDTLGDVHLMFHREGAAVRLIDAGASGGTTIDGQKVDERVLLGGERVQFGKSTLRFELKAVAAGQLSARAPSIRL